MEIIDGWLVYGQSPENVYYMKNRLLFLVVISFFVFSLPAQSQQPQKQMRQQQVPMEEMSSADRSKLFVDRIAPKLDLTKVQKDSLIFIFTVFIDDVQKYKAENTPQIVGYMQKIRDDKVKMLLRDEKKYEKYLQVLDDMKNQQGIQQRGSQPSSPGQGR